jgi:DNA repair exonuclease SbcCD ATPase subunit
MSWEKLPPEQPTWRQEFNACKNCERLENENAKLHADLERSREKHKQDLHKWRLEGAVRHVPECNYQHNPIGSPGCICIVINKNELTQLRAELEHTTTELDFNIHRVENISEDAEKELKECYSEIERLRSELETDRMRLAACGVVAMANTPESSRKARIPRDSPYWSASLGDVEAAVDREMKLYSDLEQLRNILKNLVDKY